ncbi:MAG: hypothetical protein ACYTGN_02900 [Planctomycetota bacterium]|jgi:hypothetical protein
MKRTLLVLLLALGVSRAGDDDVEVWIHAPAEDILALFPERGYMISIDEYKALVAKARAAELATAEQPPLAARLVQGVAAARLDKDLLTIEANYVAVVKGDGPAEVPFALRGVALEAIEVEGGEFAGDVLRFPAAGSYSVTASLSVRLDKRGEIYRTSFALPPAAAQKLAVDMPRNIEGEVGPIVRAFRTGEIREAVIGYPDRSGVFTLWVRPRSEARQLDPLVSASFDTLATLGEARSVLQTRLNVEILRAPVARLELALGKGQTVRALSGKKVKSWRVTRGGETDTLEVVFVEPVTGVQALALETELPRAENSDDVALPLVGVPRAVRYRGTVGIAARPEVRVTSLRATGARRLDTKGLALFEVWSGKARIDVRAERIASRTRAFTRSLLALNEGGKRLSTQFDLIIEGKPLFRLSPTLPTGWTLRRVALNGSEVDHRFDATTGRLTLVFPNGLRPGRHELQVAMDTDEVEWVPEQGEATLPFSGPRSGLDEERGYFAVAADRAFRVRAGESTGLFKVGMPELERAGVPVRDNLLYAWRFDSTEAARYAASFSIARHEPQISAVVVNRVFPSERILKSHVVARIKIERAGVRELRVALPKGTGPLVEFSGALIKEKRQPPEDADADAEIWTLAFQKRIRGEYRLDIAFDRKFERDGWDADVPAVAFPDVRETGFVVVHAPPTTAVEVERNGLREADVGELPETPQRPPLEVLAYPRHPYTVKLASKRHDPHAVIQAVALSARIYGVLTHDGSLRCRAEYRVRNNDQPFLGFVLPKGSTLIGALVDGEPVKPLVDKGVLKLPLARSKERDAPFLVAIVYDGETGELGDGDVTIARPVLDIDVLKTRYTLHLPDGYRLADHDGDLVPLAERERETVLGDLAGLAGSLAPAKGFIASDFSTTESAAGPPPPSLAEVVDRRRAILEELQEAQKTDTTAARKAAPRSNREKKLREELKKNDLRLKEYRKKGWDMAEPKSKAGEDRLKDRLTFKSKKPKAKQPMKRPKASEDTRARREQDFDEEPAEVADEPAGSPELERLNHKEAKAEGREGLGRLLAKGGKDGVPTPGGGGGQRGGRPGRRRPERALLSLDVQFVRPDNVVQLDSLAPTGAVTLSFTRVETFERDAYLGAVLGAALGLLALVAGGRRLLRVLFGGALCILALHFAGVSFLAPEFARGAAAAVLATLGLALILRLVRALGSIRFRRRKTGIATLLAIVCLAGAADAKDRKRPAPPKPPKPQKGILAPYSGVPDGVVERVFLPAAEYERLRKLAYPGETKRATKVLRADYAAALKGEELAVTARYVIVKETEAGERLALRLNGVAVVAATLDGQPATLAVEKDGYVLALRGAGRRVLEITMRPRVEASGQRRSFRIPVRPVAWATLAVTDDRPAHEMKPVALGANIGDRVHVGPVAVLGATWVPKTEGFRAAEAELRAQSETTVSVRDGYTGVATRVRYGIGGGTAERFRLNVGKDLVVRSVRCKDLAGWELKGGVLAVALGKPARGGHVIEVFGERPTAREREETLPQVIPLDVLRDAGTIALESLPGLKVEVLEAKGLMRGRASEAPRKLSAAHDKGQVHSVYRFALRPFGLKWRAYLEPTRLRAETDFEILVGRRATTATVLVRLLVERGPGPFTVEMAVPTGYEVVSAQGRLRDWWVKDGALVMARTHRQTGNEAYRVVLRRKGPTADAFEAPVTFVKGAARESGQLRIAVVDGLELDAREASNLLPLDIARVARTQGHLRRAYRYVTTPWRLVLSSREEPREIEGLVVSRIVPLQDHLRVEALVNYHVRRGLVDELSFFVPSADAPLVNAPDLREEVSEKVDGGWRYTLRLRTPTRGTVSAVVTYALPYGAPLRGVEPTGTARVQRYVAVEKVPDGQVKISGAENLDEGDIDDLPLMMPETTGATVAGVFVGSGGPIGLDVSVSRHSFEQVAKAVVHRATANVVVDRSGWTRAQLTYRVYNRSEQFLALRLPDNARLYSVLVAGEGVRPLQSGDAVLVPLRKLAIGAPTFDVDVVYAYRGPRVGEDDFGVRLPDVDGIDVRRTTLSLYVPKGYDYDFDTEMEAVKESGIAAGAASDVYQEIKELWSVAERGNRLQAERALSNIAGLENEAKRLADKVSAQTRGQTVTRQQVETQQKAIDALRRSYGKRTTPANQPQGEKDKKQAEVSQWKVNKRYLDRNRQADNTALEEFAKNQQRFRGPNGGVPPGQRAPTDPDAPPPPLPEPQGPRSPSMPKPDPAPLDASKLLDDSAIHTFRYASETGLADKKASGFGVTNFGLSTFQDTEGDGIPDFDIEVAQGAHIGDPVTRLRGAKGRLSIRIDLPMEGEVFHFQRLGGDADLVCAADEDDGAVLPALLALVCAAGAFLILRK